MDNYKDIGKQLIKSVSIETGRFFSETYKSCAKCNKFFKCDSDDEHEKLERNVYYKIGNLDVCFDCDEEVKNVEELKKQREDYWNKTIEEKKKKEKEKDEYLKTKEMKEIKWIVKFPKTRDDNFVLHECLYILDNLAKKYDGIVSFVVTEDWNLYQFEFERKFSVENIDKVKKELMNNVFYENGYFTVEIIKN